MSRFQPRLVVDTLNRHGVRYVLIGGVAATLHGSPLRTGDTDVCPDTRADNLEKLAIALRALKARIRTDGVEGGLPFSCDATFLSRVALLNLETDAGDLAVSFVPSGTLAEHAARRFNLFDRRLRGQAKFRRLLDPPPLVIGGIDEVNPDGVGERWRGARADGQHHAPGDLVALVIGPAIVTASLVAHPWYDIALPPDAAGVGIHNHAVATARTSRYAGEVIE